MPANEFLPFATAGGANVESQAAYSADPQRTQGFQTGVAPSGPFNKAWRQACFWGAVFGQLVVDTLATDCLDDGNIATHETQISNTIKAIIASVGYAPLASPALTGSPTAPTVAGNSDSSTKIATTAFVQAVRALLAPLASPAFTGSPTAPTPVYYDSSTALATTAFVRSVLPFFAKTFPDFALNNGLIYNAAHGYTFPTVIGEIVTLVCISADGGFPVGAVINPNSNTVGSGNDHGITVGVTSTNVLFNVSNNGIYITNSSPANYALDITKWKLRLTALYTL